MKKQLTKNNRTIDVEIEMLVEKVLLALQISLASKLVKVLEEHIGRVSDKLEDDIYDMLVYGIKGTIHKLKGGIYDVFSYEGNEASNQPQIASKPQINKTTNN